MTPDDYYKKAFSSLQKAAEILEYSKLLKQEPSESLQREAQAIIKLLATHFPHVEVTDEEVLKEDKKVKDNIAALSKIYKFDAEYPQLKSHH